MSYVILTEIHHTSPADRDAAILEAAELISGAPVPADNTDDDVEFRLHLARVNWDTSNDGNDMILYDEELSWACHSCAVEIEYGADYDIEKRDLADDWEVVPFYVEQAGYCTICLCDTDYAQVVGGYPIVPIV